MASTEIECKLIREGGSRIELGKTEYHFKPYTDGAHVAQVEDEEHVDIFLAIREGYRLYRGNGKPVGADAPVIETKAYDDEVKATGPAPLPEVSPEAEPEVVSEEGFPDSFDIHGVTYLLSDIVKQAQAKAEMNETEWYAMQQEARDALIESVLDGIQAAGPKAPAVEEKDERAELASQYESLYGKKPHHNTGIEKLRELIAAKQ